MSKLAPGSVAATPPSRDQSSPTNKALALRLWHDHIREHRRTIALSLVAVAFIAASTSLYPVLINWAFSSLSARDAWAISTLPWLVVVA